MHVIAEKWQTALIPLVAVVLGVWLMAFRGLGTLQSFYVLHLAVYMIHQIEEHFWPGGFRQFANANVFHSGEDDFPVSKAGVALVNIGFVWLPLGAAAMFPEKASIIGTLWFGLSAFNAVTHIAASLRLRRYNPGLVTSIALLLPFALLFLAHAYEAGVLSVPFLLLILVGGVLLHIPVAALFVVPWLRSRRAEL